MPSLPYNGADVSVCAPVDTLKVCSARKVDGEGGGLSCGDSGVKRTFFALRESSDASMVMYFSPLILTPLAITALGSLLSENDAAMAPISAAVSCCCQLFSSCICVLAVLSCQPQAGAACIPERTENPGDEAQVVWPVASQMTALSMLPVPTRLRWVIRDAL